jgi:hypothetical protein
MVRFSGIEGGLTGVILRSWRRSETALQYRFRAAIWSLKDTPVNVMEAVALLSQRQRWLAVFANPHGIEV